MRGLWLLMIAVVAVVHPGSQRLGAQTGGSCWSYAKIAAIDENNDCALSLDEFEVFILYDFVDLDLDENYVLSSDELCASGTCNEALLSRKDGDGDGEITVVEFLEGSDAVFTELDLNRDGYVQQDELLRNAGSIFGR